MIFTVTLNPAIDKTVEIPSFELGKVNRIATLRTDVGGKGINVSKCLKALGASSVAAAFFGRAAGDQALTYLKEIDIDTMSVRISYDTRTNTKIVDPELKINTDINEPGPVVSKEELNDLKEQIAARIKSGDILVLAGSLPRGIDVTVYKDWIEYFSAKGVLVFLDADGDCFKEAIQAAPYLIKPNQDELGSLLGIALNNEEDIISAAKELLQKGIKKVVVSMGAEGALFISDQGIYRAHPLKVPVSSTVGAGDSMVAALAYCQLMGLNYENEIRLSMAMGAASVMCEGTQAPAMETVQSLSRQIIFEEV